MFTFMKNVMNDVFEEVEVEQQEDGEWTISGKQQEEDEQQQETVQTIPFDQLAQHTHSWDGQVYQQEQQQYQTYDAQQQYQQQDQYYQQQQEWDGNDRYYGTAQQIFMDEQGPTYQQQDASSWVGNENAHMLKGQELETIQFNDEQFKDGQVNVAQFNEEQRGDAEAFFDDENTSLSIDSQPGVNGLDKRLSMQSVDLDSPTLREVQLEYPNEHSLPQYDSIDLDGDDHVVNPSIHQLKHDKTEVEEDGNQFASPISFAFGKTMAHLNKLRELAKTPVAKPSPKVAKINNVLKDGLENHTSEELNSCDDDIMTIWNELKQSRATTTNLIVNVDVTGLTTMINDGVENKPENLLDDFDNHIFRAWKQRQISNQSVPLLGNFEEFDGQEEPVIMNQEPEPSEEEEEEQGYLSEIIEQQQEQQEVAKPQSATSYFANMVGLEPISDEANDALLGLDERERELDDREKDLHEQETALLEMEATLVEKEVELNQVEEQLKGRESALRTQEQDFALHEESLRTRESTFQQELSARENALLEREQDIARREAALQGREQELFQRETLVQQQTNGHDAALAQREHVLTQHENELAQRAQDLAQREQQLLEKESMDKQEALETHSLWENERESLQEDLRTKEAEIEALKKELNDTVYMNIVTQTFKMAKEQLLGENYSPDLEDTLLHPKNLNEQNLHVIQLQQALLSNLENQNRMLVAQKKQEASLDIQMPLPTQKEILDVLQRQQYQQEAFEPPRELNRRHFTGFMETCARSMITQSKRCLQLEQENEVLQQKLGALSQSKHLNEVALQTEKLELLETSQQTEENHHTMAEQCDASQQTVEEEIHDQPRKSPEMVEKSLAASVVVTCISRNCRHDCLEIVARVLDFDEKQKQQVGLLASNEGGFLSSLVPGWSRGQARAQSMNMEEQSFSSLFSDFIQDEIS